MISVIQLTKKNLKLLIRARSSALIIIFAPLLLMLILGLSYNTSTYGINLGVYSSSFTEDVNTLITSLQEEDFKVVKYETSIDECVEDVKQGFVHTCINVPPSLKVEDNTPKEITFHLDPSRINLVWIVQKNLQDKFNLKSQEISESLTQNVLATLSSTKSKIGENKGNLNTVKEKNNAASSSIGSTKTTLSGADTAAVDISYDNTQLTVLAANIEEAKTKVTGAKSKLADINVTSEEKAELQNLLDEIGSKIESAYGSTNGSSGIAGEITKLQNSLNLAHAKINSFSEVVSSANTNLDSTTATLNEAVAAVDGVLAALSETENNINSLKVTEAGTIAAPLVTKIEKVGRGNTHLDFLFPALIIVVIMFSSLLLGTTLVMMEKNSPAFLRNFFLPLRKITFVVATYLTNLILTFVQIMIILGVSLFFIDEASSTFPALIVVLFISSSIFTFLGMIIGYIFTSEETGVLASISLGSLFLFVSGVILPLESVSPWLRDIMLFNPFVISEKLVREMFIFNSSLEILLTDILILAGYALALFIIILIAEAVLHQHLVHRFLKHHHKLHRENDKMNKNDV